MKRIRIRWVAAPAIVAALVVAGPAEAACNATINGTPMPLKVCALASQFYGPVQPGAYWMDKEGYLGRVGSPVPTGNLLVDVERERAERAAWRRNASPGGSGEHTCSEFLDPESGAAVMVGNC